MTAHPVLVVFTAIAIVVGVVGTLLPVLPGLWLVWAAALVYGVLGGFGTVGAIAFGVITLLGVLGTVGALLLPQREASASGIGVPGQLLATAAAIVGFFVIPVVGAPVGFVLAIFGLTVVRSWNLREAATATAGTLKAMLYAAGLQFSAGVLMGAAWIVWAVTG